MGHNSPAPYDKLESFCLIFKLYSNGFFCCTSSIQNLWRIFLLTVALARLQLLVLHPLKEDEKYEKSSLWKTLMISVSPSNHGTVEEKIPNVVYKEIDFINFIRRQSNMFQLLCVSRWTRLPTMTDRFKGSFIIHSSTTACPSGNNSDIILHFHIFFASIYFYTCMRFCLS